MQPRAHQQRQQGQQQHHQHHQHASSLSVAMRASDASDSSSVAAGASAKAPAPADAALHGGRTSPRPATSQCLHGSAAAGLSHDLIILVLSSRQKQLNSTRRREVVRRSWVRDIAEGMLGEADASATELCSVRHYFVVGDGRGAAHLWSDDVLVLPVEDGYQQIVHKVVGALRWALATTSFKYLLKTDDDSFVCAARLLELLRSLPREHAYLGVLNAHRKVITSATGTKQSELRWRDLEYVDLFNRSVYAPYMQGAGYILSADLAATVVHRAEALRTLPPVEDALVGTLVEGEATRFNRPSSFRYRNRDDYAMTVCEADTEFVLLHKMAEAELTRCHAATQHRRSERCPRGPCACRSLGAPPRIKRKYVTLGAFDQAHRAAKQLAASKSEQHDRAARV